MERKCSGFGAVTGAPNPGVCVRFVDPSQTALQASVFWRPETCSKIVSARISNNTRTGLGSVIQLCDAQCRRALLKTYDGRQHLLFQTRSREAQLYCVGEEIRPDPFVLEVIIDNFPEVETTQKLIRQVADIYRNKQVGISDREWTVEALRHRDALVAYDMKTLGCKYRDIAIHLWGTDYIAEDWGNPNRTLKNRTIRGGKRGVRMVNGDYRTLLN